MFFRKIKNKFTIYNVPLHTLTLYISTFSQNKHISQNKHTFFGLTKMCLLWVGKVNLSWKISLFDFHKDLTVMKSYVSCIPRKIKNLVLKYFAYLAPCVTPLPHIYAHFDYYFRNNSQKEANFAKTWQQT